MSDSLSGSYAESLNGKPLGCSCLSLPNPRAWVLVQWAVEPYPTYEWRVVGFSLALDEEIFNGCRWVGYYIRKHWWPVNFEDTIISVSWRLTVECQSLGSPPDYLTVGWTHYADPPAPWGVGFSASNYVTRFDCPLSPPLAMPIVADWCSDGEVEW